MLAEVARIAAERLVRTLPGQYDLHVLTGECGHAVEREGGRRRDRFLEMPDRLGQEVGVLVSPR